MSFRSRRTPILLIFTLFVSSLFPTFSEGESRTTISSHRLLLCDVQGHPVEMNIFKPGDKVIFNSWLQLSRKSGSRLEANMTWHLVICNPFNFTVFDSRSDKLYNVSESSVTLVMNYSWNVEFQCLDGEYETSLFISESLSGESIVEKAFFNVEGGVSRRLRYSVNYSITLRNMEEREVTIDRLYIAKIPNIPGFQSVVSGPNFSVPPKGYFEDPFGNKYASFENLKLKPNEVFVMMATYLIDINVSYISGIQSEVFKPDEVPRELEGFLKSQKYIESNAMELVSQSEVLTRGEQDAFMACRRIFEYVSTNITYDMDWLLKSGGAWREGQEGALWTYRNRRGLCRHFSSLYVALARAYGTPSMVVSGYAYLDLKPREVHCANMSHAWVLIYLNGYGWMPLEPQDGWWWGWKYGTSLPAHLIFVRGGLSDFKTDLGDISPGTSRYWTKGKVNVSDCIYYSVESLRPERMGTILTCSSHTEAIYPDEDFQASLQLNAPANGRVFAAFTSPDRKVYQKFLLMENGKWTVNEALPSDGGTGKMES